MLRQNILIAMMGILPACSTTYEVPTEKAPAEWLDTGSHGLEYIEGTLVPHEGRLQQGAVLLEFGVEQLRTATIQSDIVWKDAFGRERSFAAGTPVYAAQFTFFKSVNNGRKGYVQNVNSRNNPIEWCVPLEDEAVCIFWEGPDTARYMEAKGGVPLRAIPIGADGVRGPVPILLEGEVSFESSLKIEVVIQSLRKSRIDIQTNYTDGTHSELVGDHTYRRYYWDDNNQVTMSSNGVSFQLTLDSSGGGNRVHVVVLGEDSQDEDTTI